MVDIKHLEDLSKLKIEETKRKEFEKDFGQIVEFVGKIQSLDSCDQKITPVCLSDLREDEIKDKEKIDAVKLAPEKLDGQFLSPLVVE